jgi:hypothetical protein
LSSTSAQNPQLLQFTAGGHILGFSSSGIYAANGNHALHVGFVGANSVQPQADASASASGTTGLAAESAPLSRVQYSNLWPGISLMYDAPPGGTLRSTYQVGAGADVSSIRLRYNSPLTVNSDGSLAIAFETGTLNESAPRAWQVINGKQVPVAASFSQRKNEVGFALGDYDARYPLTIDPTLTWNTFLGGSNGDDWGTAIAVDGDGNIYVAGISAYAWSCWPLDCTVREFTLGSLTVRPDAFVAKLNPSGVLQWNTFLGGSGYDSGAAIALDGFGNIYVAGTSDATWGCSPTACTVRAFTNGGGSMSWEPDAFAAKLDSSGALQWNTFLGGSEQDIGSAIAVDGTGSVYVAGNSWVTWGCSTVPCTARAFTAGYGDAFAAKLTSLDGALTWNTFLGSSNGDAGNAIAVDGSGNLYLVGESYATWGTPVRAFAGGGTDAFALKLNSSGVLQWNTFLGGTWYEYGTAIAVSSGNVYVAGASAATWGTPVRAFTAGSVNSFEDGFAAKLDSSGVLLWNTFLGGNDIDRGNTIAVDAGSVYVAGYSIGTWGTPVRAFTSGGSSGGGDAFAAKLNSSDGALHWNSFLGGSGDDLGYGSAVDGSGNLLVTGRSSRTWGTPVSDFSGGVGGDGFIANLPSTVQDATAPTVGTFAAMSPSNSVNIPITVFTASDNLGVTGYKITESAAAPLPDDSGWVASAPTTYAVAGPGRYTLYPWTKDAGGNVSAVYASPASVIVTNAAVLKSISAQDGWVLEKSESSNIGWTMNNALTTFRLGDDAAKKQYRTILSFNTGPSLPDTAVITSVSLKIRRQTIIGGGNPIAAFQGVIVDLMKGTFGTAALEANDFQLMAAASRFKAFGPYKPAANAAGWYTITLPAAANTYINKSSTQSGLTQIRLRFKLDDNNNGLANYLSVFSGNAPAVSQPQLIVQYYVP